MTVTRGMSGSSACMTFHPGFVCYVESLVFGVQLKSAHTESRAFSL